MQYRKRGKEKKVMCLLHYFTVSNLTGARMEIPLELLCEDGIIDGKHLTMRVLLQFSWKGVCMHVGLLLVI